MDIIARIKPLYDDLVGIGFPALMEDNEFISIAYEIGFTNEYAEVVNEVTAKVQTNWLGFIDGISYLDVLAVFLNRLYNADPAKLPKLLIPAICRCIGFSYFIPTIKDLKRDLHLPSYAERRFFIKDSFEKLVDASLELNGHAPHESHVSEVVQTVSNIFRRLGIRLCNGCTTTRKRR